MKGMGNDGSGNNTSRDRWRTAQWLFDLLDGQYHFGFDCCADYKNKKTELYSVDFEAEEAVYPVAWMNPPFSIASRMFRHFFKVVKQGVAIYRCDNLETKIWQEIILKNCDWVFIPQGRISYTPFDITIRDGMTRFPSALIGIGVEPPKNLVGTVLIVKS